MTLAVIPIAKQSKEDFLALYLDYTDKTECPVIYSRWAAITGIGALLGRQVWIEHGHFNIYPNIYCMFIGTAGARKSTTISIQKKILNQVGYTTIAADKSSKEKFLLDLAGEGDAIELKSVEDFLWKSLDGPNDNISEILIAADEFNNFIGNGNIEFLSLLGVLWDFNGVYTNRIKTGKSVSINNPTVSILAGNTPTGFHLAFPTEALGQGFFSRLLLIHGEPRARRYTFPESPSVEGTNRILSTLQKIKTNCTGALILSGDAKRLLDKIYHSGRKINDVRFDAYNTRRFTHLLKLCIIVYTTSGKYNNIIDKACVLYAHTILTHAELYMPKALGGFGKAKNSDVAHKITQIVNDAHDIITLIDIWKHVQADLEKISNLVDIMNSLVQAEKVQMILGKGFLARRAVVDEEKDGTVDFSLLTEEERNMSI